MSFVLTRISVKNCDPTVSVTIGDDYFIRFWVYVDFGWLAEIGRVVATLTLTCLLYTSPSPRD